MAYPRFQLAYLSDRYGARTLMCFPGYWVLLPRASWRWRTHCPFLFGLILYGLTGSVQAPMNSYITNVRGNWGIGRALTFTSGLFNVGAIIGPISGGAIASHLGLKTVYLIAALVFMISTAIIFFAGKNLETHQADLESLHSGSLTHNPRFMTFLVMTFLTMFALYLPQPFTPNFLQNQQGLPPYYDWIVRRHWQSWKRGCHARAGSFERGGRIFNQSRMAASFFFHLQQG